MQTIKVLVFLGFRFNNNKRDKYILYTKIIILLIAEIKKIKSKEVKNH